MSMAPKQLEVADEWELALDIKCTPMSCGWWSISFTRSTGGSLNGKMRGPLGGRAVAQPPQGQAAGGAR